MKVIIIIINAALYISIKSILVIDLINLLSMLQLILFIKKYYSFDLNQKSFPFWKSI